VAKTRKRLAEAVNCRPGNVLRFRLVRSRSAEVPDAVVRAALASGNLLRENDRPTATDSAVTLVRGADGNNAVLKVATSQHGIARLRREGDALDRLQSDGRLGEWRAMVPVLLGSGNISGGTYLVTSTLPGIDASRATLDTMRWLTPAVVDAIGPLHLLDSTEDEVDAVLLDRLVEGPIAELRATVRHTGSVDRLAAGLRAELTGRRVMLGWTHGDLALANVMVAGQRVTGIVDWENSRQHDLTVLDLALWLLIAPGRGQPREIGARVVSRLRSDQAWLPAESRLLADRTCGNSISGRALLLLAWLRHITDTLAKSDRYVQSPVWSRRNVMPVLRVIDEQDWAAVRDRL
jgi:aminoglycoside phosphotransferase